MCYFHHFLRVPRKKHYPQAWLKKRFFVFFNFLKKKILIFWRNTQVFAHFHSHIFLYFFFWQISTLSGHLRGCRKVQNHPKIAPIGLWKWAIENLPVTWFLPKWRFSLTLLYCIEMAPRAKCLRNAQIPSLLVQDTLWVRLNMVWSHYFAVLSLILWHREQLRPSQHPLTPPGPPRTSLTPHMLFLAVLNHPGSLWVIFEPLGVSNWGVTSKNDWFCKTNLFDFFYSI